MFCPVCGNKVEDNVRFCSNCGNEFKRETQEQDVPIVLPDDEKTINAFLEELDNATSSNKIINDNTEEIHQDNAERLFLDDSEDDDDLENEEKLNAFFNNLESIEAGEDLTATTDYVAESERKIAPILEDVPDIPETLPEIPLLESVEEDLFDDDYSDIVIGNAPPVPTLSQTEMLAPAPAMPTVAVEEDPVTENNAFIQASNTQATAEPSNSESIDFNPEAQTAIDAFVATETTTKTSDETQPLSVEGEPHILIDERPEVEQNSSPNNFENISIDINSVATSPTPFLDSFISRPDVNVDFENPFEKATEASDKTAMPNQKVDVPPVASPTSADEMQAELNAVPCTEQETHTIVPATLEEVRPDNQCESEDNQLNVTETTNNAFAQQVPNNGITEMPAPVADVQTNAPQEHALLSEENTTASNVLSQSQEHQPTKKNHLVIGIFIGLATMLLVCICALVGGLLINEYNAETTANPSHTENVAQTENAPDWEIKNTSSIEAPLIIGDSAQVSRYIDDTKCYSNVLMKFTKVIRGKDALSIVNEYENSSTIVFEEPNEGIEYVIVEYQVYIPSEAGSKNTTANLPIEIRGSASSYVTFSDKAYAISTWCVNDGCGASSGSLVTCQEIFQLPIGCSDYYVVFGGNAETTATFKGE